MQDEWLVRSWASSVDAAFSRLEPLFVDLVALHRLDRLLGLHFGLHRRLALIYLDQLAIVDELVAFTADLRLDCSLGLGLEVCEHAVGLLNRRPRLRTATSLLLVVL